MPVVDAWSAYRKKRWVVVLVFLGFLPIGFPLAVALSRLSGSGSAFYMVAFGWALALVVVYVRLAFFPCPRCGKAYFSRWWYYNPLSGACVHCGLPKWSHV